MTELESLFLAQIQAEQLPDPIYQHLFHPKRKWRFDFCWPEEMLAVEINGGNWIGGAHARATGLKRDYEKLNAAQNWGWRVLQFDADMVKDGTAIQTALGAFTLPTFSKMLGF